MIAPRRGPHSPETAAPCRHSLTPHDFSRVYAEHAPQVWRVLRRLGVPESEVSDATQDVFLVVHRRLPEFEGRSKMSTWLFQICLRVASDRRRSARAREVPIEGLLDQLAATTADAESALRRRQELAALEAILDRMEFDQRTVFIMFELEELAGEEIAEILQLPVGTVRSRLRLARESFREAVARLEARQRFSSPKAGGHP